MVWVKIVAVLAIALWLLLKIVLPAAGIDIEFDKSFFAAIALVFIPLIFFGTFAWKTKSKNGRRFGIIGLCVWIALWLVILSKVPLLR